MKTIQDLPLDLTKIVALSIRQPWPWHILFSGKDIENRTWRTSFRGPVLIHAGKQPEDPELCKQLGTPLGGIVGVMEIVNCVTESESDWFHGPYGFVIENAEPIDFIPCRGALGFFQPTLLPSDEAGRPRPTRQPRQPTLPLW